MSTSKRLTVAVITGTRAEFGLLRPVMHAIRKHKKLKLQVIVAGAHFLKPARTIREVEAEFPIAARVPMQGLGMRALRAGSGESGGRLADSLATARGLEGFARAYAKLKPDWVVVLGDRIEAFAAASAASIGGIPVCHIHGGDRAEGIADEAMRHAITKLAHLHCAATKLSAERIIKMGENPEHVHVTGSPAIDGLDRIRPMSDAEAREIGDPSILMLFHPVGRADSAERMDVGLQFMGVATYSVSQTTRGRPPVRGLILDPNHDPGREGIVKAIAAVCGPDRRFWHFERRSHLPRQRLLSLMSRLARRADGLMFGNSSAGLIEASRLALPAVNVGPRQSGRERDRNVIQLHDSGDSPTAIRAAIRLHGRLQPSRLFGDGRASPRIANLLAKTNPHDPALLRKRNTY